MFTIAHTLYLTTIVLIQMLYIILFVAVVGYIGYRLYKWLSKDKQKKGPPASGGLAL